MELAQSRGRAVITSVDLADTTSQTVLRDAGFGFQRREIVVEFGVRKALAALGDARPPSQIEICSAGEADVDRLRLLDDELRQDVPGTAGWRNDPAEFSDDTFGDSAFDPRTYLVAVDTKTGEYIGLVRIWMNPARPRVGMIGVRRAFRRGGIASALLARALEAVDSDGVTVVSTEFDTSNSASRILFERLGAREVTTRLEFTGSPSRAHRDEL
jgi:ribosomal protein S18 acetylase RimI-like enzyme